MALSPDKHPAWHSLSTSDVFRELSSSEAGLTGEEARRRLEQHGPNELEKGQGVSAWKILLSQFQNVLLVILIIATALSAFMGHGTEAAVIAVIVLLAVGLGFFQEYRAERAMEALAQMAAPHAKAIRDGQETDITARHLVPGDVI